MCWASNLIGLGPDFAAATGLSDADALSMLRRIQRKIGGTESAPTCSSPTTTRIYSADFAGRLQHDRLGVRPGWHTLGTTGVRLPNPIVSLYGADLQKTLVGADGIEPPTAGV
jgi:hypothetical protein